MIKELPNVTLIAVCGNKHGETISSIYKSLRQIKPAKVAMLTNKELSASGIEVINVGGLETWEAYNEFVVKELYKYFDTDYCLIVQWDSWVLDSECWDDVFLNFDYIGAKWLEIGKPLNTGNGGFSLRSKKLQTILGTDPYIKITAPEDTAINKIYGVYLQEKYGIKFCTEEIADKFAFELNQPLHKTFGFHAFHHEPYKETVVIKRKHALGDVLMLEPVLNYFFKKGYRVALDTLPDFQQLYSQHYFPVYPKTSLHPQLPYREIDLDMAYENNPKQLVLKSYFEAAGIKDEPLRNSRLSLYSGGNEKLFKKYAVIHIDSTSIPHRDIQGLLWQRVVQYLEDRGYSVFQIGKRIDFKVATIFNTMNIDFLKFFLKGADLFIGVDSAPSQIAVAFGIPSVIFFGSVNPQYRYADLRNISVVQNSCPREGCYHEVISEKGQDCYYNKEMPPCVQFTAEQTIKAIKKFL